MTEALRLGVTVVVHLALLLLRTVIPGQLKETLPLGHRVLGVLARLWVGRRVSQEIQIEGRILVLNSPQQRHTHHLLVELQTGLGRLDAKHGVVEAVVGRISRSTDILVVAADDFHPVAIGVLGEGDVLHATLGEFLLEWVAGILESLAGGLDVIDGDSDVAESTVRFRVSVGDAVVGVALGAVVVGELQHGVTIRPVTITLQRLGAIVCEEVQRELVFGEVQLLDLVETEELVEFHWAWLASCQWVMNDAHILPDFFGSFTRIMVSASHC